MKTIGATEFKAKCLAIVDEVARTGEPVAILKRGKPVAQLLPPVPRQTLYPQYALRGTGGIIGDIKGHPRPPTPGTPKAASKRNT